MTYHSSTILLSVLLSLLFCTCSQPTDFEKTQWILGTWETQTHTRTIYETWTLENDHALFAASYRLANFDTIFLERIQLVKEGETLFFKPTVEDQNEGATITFTLKSIHAHGWEFENPDHDFPQLIAYERVGIDSLVATVSGTVDGEHRERSFGMKRVAK